MHLHLKDMQKFVENFGDRVKYWQPHNEQNLMMRVKERMNIYESDAYLVEKMRAQMDYHMSLAHALAVRACHEMVRGWKNWTINISYSYLPIFKQARRCMGSKIK